ncbi:type III secretion system export apparatus subunit SctT [Bradyrhizobium sp. ISRA443]|uniref:type III secretion system export apparatus subunit SctT n=1 Tax=unclassified Bradyrhizobium TaxID=2631580 RepID=UPI00247A7BD7|nr:MULTISPECIES: type III secretion system export apparatus subunit SctT [unclassified Bradyrhizobium]WGR98115.1 type III secretion system export apparatus subunit SctT [Bradyrhizobium sp. ISRA436]WGS05003.1 type III secretion system export apparatus subunit SctT [Bradyrhizobium sp. ISRA437]WGS11888.1 type III secretion system export apparatus subunit SctT [Bradyrhizobium sp. ISRA443]
MHNVSFTETQILIQTGTEFIIAAGLGAARALGIMLVHPVFTRPHISGMIRGSLTIALGLPCLAHIRHSLQMLDPGTRMVAVALLGLKEIFIGLLFGILLSIPLWSIQAVGDIIDTQRGISSQVDDPATHSQASATGLFLGTAAVTIFVLSGGLQTMVRCLYGSYLIWPVDRLLPPLTQQGAMEFVALLDHIMRTTLLVSGPVLALLLLIEASLMLLGRFAPQIKLNDLSPTIKNAAFGVIMVSYTVYLIEYMGAEITQFNGVLEWLEKFLK